MSQPVELKHIRANGDDKGGMLNSGYDGPTGDALGVAPTNVYVNVDQEANSDLRQRHAIKALDEVNADEDDSDLGPCKRGINGVQRAVINVCSANSKLLVRIFLFLLFVAYLCYFGYAMYYRFGDEGSWRLLVCTILGLFLLVIHLAGDHLEKLWQQCSPDVAQYKAQTIRTITKWVLYVVSLVTMVTLLIWLVALDTPENLISLAGLAGFVLLAWITSINPARVNWHPVFWGFSLQFYFAVVILRTRWGYNAFKWLGDRVTEFLALSDEGAKFLFGDGFKEHFFAFSILPVIVFFSAIISVLYYIGVMQVIINTLGKFLSFCMGTTPAESINAAGNIFVGMTEAPLLIRPFISKMTKSELHAVMTGGFATIAGSVLGAYIGFGVPANHLISASVMSAPAALAISKLTYPETETPEISSDDYSKVEKGTERNLIDAASAGASASVSLVANVAVNVMAFLSILKFVNVTLTWFGDRVGVEGLSFEFICSYVMYPVSIFMGVAPGLDCRRIGELVGIKTFTNEFVAYESLKKLLENRKTYLNYTTMYNASDPVNLVWNDMDVNLTQWNRVLEKGFLSQRSEVIATYALCGFSNFGSMGILLGSLVGMAPNRRSDLAAIVLRAMISGNIACFFTACIAGLFFEDF